MTTQEHNTIQPEKKGGFIHGLPDAQVTTVTQGGCCGTTSAENAVGGCCGEPTTQTALSESVPSVQGCCGELGSTAKGTANVSGCCGEPVIAPTGAHLSAVRGCC